MMFHVKLRTVDDVLIFLLQVAVEEEISAHHPQSVVNRLCADMEESLLTDNLDQMYGTEYAIEEVT
jgi:hypothetical protein